jgi:hypothetical protein
MNQPNSKDNSMTFGLTVVQHLFAFIASTLSFFVVWVSINWGYNIESLALTVQCACLWAWLFIFVVPSCLFLERRFAKNPKFSWFTRALIVLVFYSLVSAGLFELILLILTGQFPSQSIVPFVVLLVSIPSFVYWVVLSSLKILNRQS